jgi:HAD superfamily hydrolase (TIGR01509 family)
MIVERRATAVKAVLADFDMTLVNTFHAVLNSINLFAKEMGVREISDSELLAAIGLPLEESWVRYWGGYEPSWPEHYRNNYKDVEIRGFKLFPDTIITLEKIRAKGIKTAVVTNRWMADMAVKEVGLDPYMDAVVGADQVVKPKPDAEPVLTALKLLGVDKEEAVFAGDSEIDVYSGINAKVDAIAVATGSASKEDLKNAGAKWVVGSLSEILPIIGIDR